MIKTTEMLLDELASYANPYGKIGRMVKSRELFQLTKGLYETNGFVSGACLAGAIYGPSYLSFEYALSYYGMIPEAVYSYTSATFDKKKIKSYENDFGTFTYRDVPKKVYPFGIEVVTEGEYTFQIATAEKALCDKLYIMPPVKNIQEMGQMLVEDLRVDRDYLQRLKREDISFLRERYHCKNVELLDKYMRRLRNE